METIKKSNKLGKALPYIILVVIALFLPFVTKTRFWLNIFVVVMFKMIGSVSLRTLGLSGNMSFAQGAFVGVGAYVTGMMARWLGLPPYLTIPAGALAALILGVVTGFPFVRLRNTYFCMASMFLGVTIVYIISAGGVNFTGGGNGLTKIPAMFSNTRAYYYFFLGLTIFSCAVMYRFEFSRIGTTLRALSQSPEVAASIGISETLYRLLAVGVGCFFAGLSGACYALYSTALSPNSYGMSYTLWLIMYMMIGGQDDFLGPIVGTILLVIIPEYFRSFGTYAPFASAAALVLVAYFLPGGLVSLPRVIKDAIVRAKDHKTEAKEEVQSIPGGGE